MKFTARNLILAALVLLAVVFVGCTNGAGGNPSAPDETQSPSAPPSTPADKDNGQTSPATDSTEKNGGSNETQSPSESPSIPIDQAVAVVSYGTVTKNCSSLQEALECAAANSGSVITLQKNLTESIKIIQGNLTLDLNGHTVASDTALEISQGVALVVKDSSSNPGTISGTNTGIYNGGTLTLENGFVKGIGETAFGIHNTSTGNLTVKGG